jgi:hypothetical protein
MHVDFRDDIVNGTFSHLSQFMAWMDGSSQSQCQMDKAAHIEIEIEWWKPSPTGEGMETYPAWLQALMLSWETAKDRPW